MFKVLLIKCAYIFEVHKETLMNKSRTSDIVRARNVIHNLLYRKISHEPNRYR